MTGRRVLLVEDETLIALETADLLEELGHRIVAAAARLGEALALAAEAEVDLALLDVNLAGETSYPVARLLQARGTPVVFATGFAWQGLDILFPGVPVLEKPFGRDELDRVIRRVARP